MALRSTQPLTEMSTSNISLGGGRQRRPVHMADNPATFICRLSRNYGSLNLLQHLRPEQEIRLPFLHIRFQQTSLVPHTFSIIHKNFVIRLLTNNLVYITLSSRKQHFGVFTTESQTEY